MINYYTMLPNVIEYRKLTRQILHYLLGVERPSTGKPYTLTELASILGCTLTTMSRAYTCVSSLTGENFAVLYALYLARCDSPVDLSNYFPFIYS